MLYEAEIRGGTKEKGFMKTKPWLVMGLLAVLAGVALAEDWPHWRGPTRDGISGETGLPTEWSPTQNVTWKIPMPDRSGSTPLRGGETIFLNVADGGDTPVE